MPRTVVICVNGILTWPGSARAWTDVATTELLANDIPAEKFEYLALPLTRRIMQQLRAERLSELIKLHHARGARVVAWGHSNGCDLIARALKLGAPLHSAHLMAPAVDSDMDLNGLNDALYHLTLGQLYIYTGGQDLPIRFAYWTGKLLHRLGLGYGSMGYTGPENIEPMLAERVDHIHFRDYGHGSWFTHGHMQQTLAIIQRRLP